MNASISRSTTEESCYCCPEPAIGQGDHVPPKSLFPSGSFSTAKPVIVPSCKAHNEANSDADEYLKFVMSASSESSPKDVMNGTIRSIIRNMNSPRASLDRFGIMRVRDKFKVGNSAPVNSSLLERALSKVARGVYYHHHGGSKKLQGDIVVLPIFLGTDPDAPAKVAEIHKRIYDLAISDLLQFKIEGAWPDVFLYQVIETESSITINMIFYKNKIATVQKRLK